MSEMRPQQPGVVPGIRQITPAAPAGSPGPARIAPLPAQPAPKPHDSTSDPIILVDERTGAPAPSKIKLMGITGSAVSHDYKRQPVVTGHGACRVRSFHGRMSDEGLTFLDDKVNEWLDNHPEIEVKFVSTQIGVFEGKIREPALVVNVWY